MDRKTFAIGILTLTAVILFIAQFLPVRPAMANDSIGDRDYQLVTVRTQQGGDALYVFQRRSGMVAVFNWDAERSPHQAAWRSDRSGRDPAVSRSACNV